MKAILLCGYRLPSHEQEVPGQNTIDRQIEALEKLGLEVVCVLAGAVAEAQLRLCRRIADADLVFDTNDEPNLMSNLRAGLRAVEEESCLILPMDVACPELGTWRALLNETLRLGACKATGLHFMTPQGGAWYTRFPLVLTREGVKTLLPSSDVQDLSDTRLRYVELEVPDYPDLAPSAKPL